MPRPCLVLPLPTPPSPLFPHSNAPAPRTTCLGLGLSFWASVAVRLGLLARYSTTVFPRLANSVSIHARGCQRGSGWCPALVSVSARRAKCRGTFKEEPAASRHRHRLPGIGGAGRVGVVKNTHLTYTHTYAQIHTQKKLVN
ncbi:hypothetical protein O3P69_001169 [Scylla paramamosain]|uniref:Uncharacterized protein n=1 Tax=Scylla paramamosain TaxID=85552 RepID=A0AAW0URN1_SCYPA